MLCGKQSILNTRTKGVRCSNTLCGQGSELYVLLMLFSFNICNPEWQLRHLLL
uniref:Uncharacterized protein n=1 Tax=Kalanchoe fedtschenkoi TaxID=63787 RepID=A0A7N0TNZ9_KALFE